MNHKEISLGDHSQNIQQAGQVSIYNADVHATRIDYYYRQLHWEVENNITGAMSDDLLDYTTHREGTPDLEQRLIDGGFSRRDIEWARRKKEQYERKAAKYGCYPSDQEIDLLIFGEIKIKFDHMVFPDVKRGMSVEYLLQQTDRHVVMPIVRIINNNGTHDQELHYTTDHIYGMIYLLTANGHLDWKDYDKV